MLSQGEHLRHPIPRTAARWRKPRVSGRDVQCGGGRQRVHWHTQGVLQGSGPLGGTVVASAGAVVSAGLSPGCMTYTGDVDLSAGGVLLIEYEAPGECSGYDVVTVLGDLIVGPDAVIEVRDIATSWNPPADPITVVRVSGTFDGSGSVSFRLSSAQSGSLIEQARVQVAGGNTVVVYFPELVVPPVGGGCGSGDSHEEMLRCFRRALGARGPCQI
eukprot:TRINITY_DN1635_c0_g1_i2.p1 TRINITY_DN1635_c0_g1~~TRINITY_DN1635_c0_g1_i2.p1  ORF type:complete len:216 (-),score=33.24 TRINITY_DN1635_c0_g1_i2:457-1104(-)